MAVLTISPGGLVTKDPSAQKVYQFDWTSYLANLGAEVIQTSTFAIAGDDAVLTFDSATLVAGNLLTQLRLLGGTLGKRYTVTNHIVTNGSPANVDERSFSVLIQDL